MAGNSFKHTAPEASESSKKSPQGGGLFSMIEKSFKMDKIFEEGVPVKYLPHILWVTVLAIIYIANAHYTEKTTRKIESLKHEVEDLRADYITLKADYMYASKQSEVAKKVAPMGLLESKEPPVLIQEK